VLTSDAGGRGSRGGNEGTGEPETLWGRINPKGFGDRAGAGKKDDLEEMKTKAKSK
jgi:pre-mRNA-splicing helicase BRR2